MQTLTKYRPKRRIPRHVPDEAVIEVQSRTLMSPREIELLYARQARVRF